MTVFEKRTVRVLLTVLAFAAALGFLYLARKTLIIFLFAMLFAYLLEPVIGRVQQWTGRPRGFAIAVVYVGMLLVLGGAGTVVGPRVLDEGRKLGQSAPELYQKITTGNIAWQFGQQRGWSYETQVRIRDTLASHKEYVQQTASLVGTRAAELAANLGWVVLIPILSVFFLKDKSKISEAIQRQVENREDRVLLRAVMADLDAMLSHFVRAQLVLALISGAVYTIALTALRVPYSFVLGAIGGLLEFIPVVGPLVAAVLILGVAFTVNYHHMLMVLIFLGAWRVVQDYVISPKVLGGKVELHPLMAIFGVLVGGEIAGVVGVYLAIPALATLRILWVRWQTYKEAAWIAPKHPESVIRPGERAA